MGEKETLVVNSEGKRPFGVLGANGLLVSILISNGVDNVGKNNLSQHVTGFREYGNEQSGSIRCGKFLRYLSHIGFGGLGVACMPLVPNFAGSNPAEAVGFLGRKNPQHAFLRRGSKAVGPIS